MVITNFKNTDDEIARLQRQLSEAVRVKDKVAEVSTLLTIGAVARESNPQLSHMHFKLAEKVIRVSKKLDRLHEALGGQGRALRREKRFDDAIARFVAAEQAAEQGGHEGAQVMWMLQRASAHRANNHPAEAKTIVEEADKLLRPPRKHEALAFLGGVNFGDKEQVQGLAELEGQIGLILIAENDEEGAEDHYRSALCFAQTSEDWGAANTWGTNVGNSFLRRSKYTEALSAYEAALDAGMKEGSASGVLNTAARMATCYAVACRHEEGGERLRALADAVGDDWVRVALLGSALMLFDEGLCAERALETANVIEPLIAGTPVREDFVEKVASARRRMERLTVPAPAPTEGPPALDLILSEYMSRAEASGRIELALLAAHLVCDVRLGLALAGQKQWKRLIGGDMLENAGLDLRVITDTLRKLLDAQPTDQAEQTDQALDLLQRFKAPSFCVPTLMRMLKTGAPSAESAAYLQAAHELGEQVLALAGPARIDFMRVVNSVRRAGERLREAGEALREVDPILHARMGGSVRKADMVDALPYAGGVGIVDFVVGSEATVGVVLVRWRAGVAAIALIAPTFNVRHVERLNELYAEGDLSRRLGGGHEEALSEISRILHDNFFCKLAQWVTSKFVSQLILIPDLFTRSLPLHLAYACGKEFAIPGIDTSDANYLCEVMPIEYSPCLQAVAASQVHLRPREIRRIAAFADPNGDLPGVRASMEEFGQRAGDPAVFRLEAGDAVTKAAVTAAVRDADIVMFGTHGAFSPGNLEETHLVLHGASWTVADMLGMPDLQRRALLVLVACEAGAVAATPDERVAWGIPGALVTAGASAVLANLWPVEDITSNILLERFLKHLSHRGYRPAAALFRGVRDLRRMGREEALATCRTYLEDMKQRKAEARVLVGARSMVEWLEGTDAPRPFAHPFFWGAAAIFGSGWHLPTGELVGSPEQGIQNLLRLQQADELVANAQPRQALKLAEQVANTADGVPRGHAYATMAQALLDSAEISTRPVVSRKAARLLRKAQRIADNEGDDQLRRWVESVQAQLEDDHVVKKDD